MSTQWVTKRTRKGPTDEANSTIDFSMIQNDGTLNHGFCEEEEPSMSAPGGAMTSISTQTDPNLKPSMVMKEWLAIDRLRCGCYAATSVTHTFDAS